MRSVSTHAEIDALNKLLKLKISKKDKRKYEKMDLLVVRLSKTIGRLGISRPCYHCLSTLMNSDIEIKYVYYSTNDGRIVREKFKDMIESELTKISTGWRKRLGIYYDDIGGTELSDSSDSEMSEEELKESYKSKKSPKRDSIAKIDLRSAVVLSPSGEIKRVTYEDLKRKKII